MRADPGKQDDGRRRGGGELVVMCRVEGLQASSAPLVQIDGGVGSALVEVVVKPVAIEKEGKGGAAERKEGESASGSLDHHGFTAHLWKAGALV
jgi:hypothetical protein